MAKDDAGAVADTSATTRRPSVSEQIDAWYRDTFQGSRMGRELSDHSHHELRNAVEELKTRIAKT